MSIGAPQSMAAPLDSRSTLKNINTSITNTSMSRLAQSASVIQGQMAASQIPLCIVQDPNGQLHQLVYMVPEHLYQSYITAASKGLKVNLPPKFDKFNALLNGAGGHSQGESLRKATSGTRTSLSAIFDKNSRSPTTATDGESSSRKLKKVRSPAAVSTSEISCTMTSKPTVETSPRSHSKEKVSAKDKKNQSPEAVIKSEPSIETMAVRTSQSPNKPIGQSIKSPPTTHVVPSKALDPHQIICDPMITRFYSPTTVQPPGAMYTPRDTQFLTKELLPLLTKTNRGNSQSKNSKKVELLKKELCTKNLVRKSKEQHKENHIDLTVSSAKGKLSSNTKKESKNSNPKKLQQTNRVKSVNKEQTVNTDKEKSKKVSESSIIYPEPIDNVSIDTILSQNNSDLIPKSDVESLLKCLKRKLEEKEDAERSKRVCPGNPSLFTDEPGELFSSFDGSPVSEQADSPNLYFQSQDLGSVSSVDSALSYNQQSSVSSENSEFNSNAFNFLDEILADDSTLKLTPAALQNKILQLPEGDLNEGKGFSDGLVTTLQNQTQDNIDLSFLDNIKDFECDNMFNTTDTTKSKDTNSSGLTYVDNVSFPTQHSTEEVDLFDHLWNDIDNL